MIKKIILLLLIATIITACGSKEVIVRNLYLIELEDEHRQSFSTETVPLVNELCEVADIRISPVYSSLRIPLRNDSHQIQYFENHEWAIRPQEAISHIIIDFFTAQHIFNRVASRFWTGPPAYQIQTKIHNIEVIHENRDFIAHLNIELKLLDNNKGDIILSHSASRKSELESRDLNLMAKTISQLLYEELIHFSDNIRQYFETQNQ